MTSLLQRVALLVPVGVFVLWAGSQEYQLRDADVLHFSIAAYDPRDLLSGHYLTYRIDYGAPGLCAEWSYGTQCVCLRKQSGTTDFANVYWHGSCDVKPDCELWLRGVCSGGTFLAGVERFYFPERYKDRLIRPPDQSTIDISVTASGAGFVRELFVQGKPLLRYLEETEAASQTP